MSAADNVLKQLRGLRWMVGTALLGIFAPLVVRMIGGAA